MVLMAYVIWHTEAGLGGVGVFFKGKKKRADVGRTSPMPRADLTRRVLHLLALKPHSRSDLEQRLKIVQGDAGLTNVLEEVCWFLPLALGLDIQRPAVVNYAGG